MLAKDRRLFGSETKDLNCSRHRKQQDHQHIALVLFAETHGVVQWAQITPAHTVGCITGEDPRAKSAELFEQIGQHYSKQHTTQPYPSPLSTPQPQPCSFCSYFDILSAYVTDQY